MIVALAERRERGLCGELSMSGTEPLNVRDVSITRIHRHHFPFSRCENLGFAEALAPIRAGTSDAPKARQQTFGSYCA